MYCKNIQRSKVFAGRADLSLKAFQKILTALDAALVIQPEAQLRKRAGVAGAVRALELAGR